MLSLQTKIKEFIKPETLFELDFITHAAGMKRISNDNCVSRHSKKNGNHFSHGHYEMSLPFQDDLPYLPNNQSMAKQRFKH